MNGPITVREVGSFFRREKKNDTDESQLEQMHQWFLCLAVKVASSCLVMANVSWLAGCGRSFRVSFCSGGHHQTQLLNITVKANQGRHSNGFWMPKVRQLSPTRFTIVRRSVYNSTILFESIRNFYRLCLSEWFKSNFKLERWRNVTIKCLAERVWDSWRKKRKM